jgi:hypothetical protein
MWLARRAMSTTRSWERYHLAGATQEDIGRLGQVLSDHGEQFDDLGFNSPELTVEFLSFLSKARHGQRLYAPTSPLPEG